MASLGTKFVTKTDIGLDNDKLIRGFQFRYHIGGKMFSRCSVKGCNNTNVQIHHIRKLARTVIGKEGHAIVNAAGRKIKGITALLSSISRKPIQVCPYHHRDFEKGIYHAVDTEYLSSIYNSGTLDDNRLKSVFESGEYISKQNKA